MEYRIVPSDEVKSAVKSLLLRCNFCIPEDVRDALAAAKKLETSSLAIDVLDQLLENNRIAQQEQISICQDAGMAVLFVEYGDRVVISGESFSEALENGVREAYIEGYLRKSVVSDPVFNRSNTNDNTPAIVHTEIVPGTSLRITAGCKGFGSENMSKIEMLSPADGIEGIKKFVIDTVRKAGPNPCPPIIVGVGIGGTFEKAALLSKKATFRAVGTSHSENQYAALEKELLKKINRLGIGPAGLCGKTTALCVNVETFPTHIAGLPVAVNICCHAARHHQIVI